MNSANYVDSLVADLRQKVNDGLITLSEAGWRIAIACVGWAYVFGAWGDYCTVNEREKRYKYHNIASILEKCQRLRKDSPKGTCEGCKWYPNGEKTRCFDCRGFDDWVEKMLGYDLEGEGATGQWNTDKNWCYKSDDMSAIPQGILVNVFIWDKTGKTMKHTGLYYNGATCECSNGVQMFDPMKKSRWTHWAIARCFENEWNNLPVKPVEPPKTPVNDPGKEDKPVSYKTIRRGNYGELVKTCQTLLQNQGYSLGVCGIDSDFGQATEQAVRAFQKDHGLKVDGIVGPKTWEALLADSTIQAPVYYTVTISHRTKSVAEEIINKYGGTMTAEKG